MTQQKYEAFYLRFMYSNKKQMLRFTGSTLKNKLNLWEANLVKMFIKSYKKSTVSRRPSEKHHPAGCRPLWWSTKALMVSLAQFGSDQSLSKAQRTLQN